MTIQIPVTVVRSKWFEKPVEYAVDSTPEKATHLLAMEPGDVFEALGDIDMSEGRGGRHSIGYFTTLTGAANAARSQGAQGSFGYVSLISLVSAPLFATDSDGSKVEFGTRVTPYAVNWESRLTAMKPAADSGASA